MLPEATPAQFAHWLKTHPGVEIIARNRGHAYAEDAGQGAPHAIQVADRWHLTSNLGEAVQAVLHRQTAALRTAARRLHAPDDVGMPDETLLPPVFPHGHIIGPAALRQQQFTEVNALHQQGWSVRRIAQHLHLHRRTVTRYALAEHLPRQVLPQATSSVTPYRDYLLERWHAGCRQGLALWAEHCGVRELQQFAHGLRRDYESIKVALLLPWSTGLVEAQVNRLKLVKRMMYGRANFDLLRLRVLHAI